MAPLVLVACADLKQSKPILPIREYEKMIVGRLDAEYVGTDNCVAKCHKHDKITDDFKHSVHGEQIKPENNLPLVNCESCHGPGSLAIAQIGDDVAANDARKVKCDTSTFLDIMHLPPQAQSLICLKCHSAESTPNLTHWNASPHALNDVSCLDCHKLHQGPQQKARREQISELCFGCHPEIEAEGNLFSHHPLREKKMACVDCHNPHGSTQEKLLLGTTPKETCTRCHMEKQGPFAFEHGDVTENCMPLPFCPWLGQQQPAQCGHAFSLPPVPRRTCAEQRGCKEAVSEPLYRLPFTDPRQRHSGTCQSGKRNVAAIAAIVRKGA